MKIVIFFIALLSLTACDNSTWVDMVGMGCTDGKPGDGRADPAAIKLFAQKTCAGRQKNYTGDFQCKGNQFQVKCK